MHLNGAIDVLLSRLHIDHVNVEQQTLKPQGCPRLRGHISLCKVRPCLRGMIHRSGEEGENLVG